MTRDPDGFPFDPDPLHVEGPASPWEHQRQQAKERDRMRAAGVRHANLGCLWALLVCIAFWFLLALLVVNLAAPRSAETTAPDPTRDVSAPTGPSARLSGAPQIPRHWLVGGRTGAGGPNALHDAGTRRGAPSPSPSPAVANVATSEGPTGPTTPMPATTFTGYAGWAVESLGPRYLAIREPRGTLVTICGPAACWTTVSTDYGPSSRIRPGRVADIAVGRWEAICGLPRRYGLCEVTITIERRPGALPTAPATDSE